MSALLIHIVLEDLGYTIRWEKVVSYRQIIRANMRDYQGCFTQDEFENWFFYFYIPVAKSKKM